MPGKEREPGQERQPDNLYTRASRYVDDEDALAAYDQAQAVLFRSDCDLSAYRIRLRDVPHVVVLGSAPSPELDERILATLETGEPANLPQDIIQTLAQRRTEAQRLGPWVEGHYRPGEPM